MSQFLSKKFKYTFSTAVIILAIFSLSVWGLGLGSIAETGQTGQGVKISADTPGSYDYIDNYVYPNGILVFTYADTGSSTSDTGNAAITAGDTINYYMEITNQGSVPKEIDLKFTIPKNYSLNIDTVIECSAGIIPCPTSTSMAGPSTVNWGKITVPAGESRIGFKLKT